MTAYSIGVDFGTESGRAALVDLATGEERSPPASCRYPSAVIDETLPSTGERLPPDWALQDPDDWVMVVEDGLRELVEEAGVDAEQVVGLGVDFTSCTVLPVTATARRCASSTRGAGAAHAWPKLWKHHAAQPVADRLNEVALERGDAFLDRYGGRISSEWYFPKLIEVWLEDREIYDECARLHRGDRLDRLVADRGRVPADGDRGVQGDVVTGARACRRPSTSRPPIPGSITPGEKLGDTFVPLGTKAGTLRPEVAKKLKLPESVAVAVGNVDAWVSVPGVGVDAPGTYVIVIGTSICDMIVHPEETRLPGITGVVKDGILPGLYGYEAGQAAVGDMLAWFVDEMVDGPGRVRRTRATPPPRSARARPGWSRSTGGTATARSSPTPTSRGAIFGLGLHTTREQIYRALLESIAFGSRRIMDNFEEHGLVLSQIVACGGIAERSPLMMQLLADTSGREVHVPDVAEIPARGAALFGARGGRRVRRHRHRRSRRRGRRSVRTYKPDLEAKKTYDRVYEIYRTGCTTCSAARTCELMHDLKRIRTERREA